MTCIHQIDKKNLSDGQLDALKKIFFEASSKKSFASPKEKSDFFYRWFGFYLDLNDSKLLIASESEQPSLALPLGYLIGCIHSEENLKIVSNKIKSFSIFEQEFEKFPAHFHINVGSESRGLGLGQKLVAAFVEICKAQHIAGVHIVTSPEARNVQFYKKLGFSYKVTGRFGDTPLLFMGRCC